MDSIKKKYQVFVSSTYSDLKEERMEVIQALLEFDCIPAGMELFPASDDDQWTLIKSVIDDSDYYIVIIAGRYGSEGPKGISYTEMEYRYALERKKPIIAFLHKNPGSIAVNKSEEEKEVKLKLTEFRRLAETRMCKSWTDPKDLKSMVNGSLFSLQKKYPAIGWVRADLISPELSKRIFELTEENERYKETIEKFKFDPPEGTEKFASGDDIYVGNYIYYEDLGGICETSKGTFETTWNKMFYFISPYLTEEVSEDVLRKSLNSFITEMSVLK